MSAEAKAAIEATILYLDLFGDVDGLDLWEGA
jgi:hypothetical protein